MLGQMYLALPFSMINILAFQTNERGEIMIDMLLPLSIFIFLWTNDTGAYCCGSLFGKHKLFPRISPKKSWEGSMLIIEKGRARYICPNMVYAQLLIGFSFLR